MTFRDHDLDDAVEKVTVFPCPGGPLLVRGPISVSNPDGSAFTPTRQTVAFCRCGRSTISPMCDGSHKLGRSGTG
ncbi:CDGSH iron-sulfur domain-containing protein [Gordonia sp. HY002]|uniref:CDGSH iron-sulfur domain-containing protein n=1 Tax=Gordonia zhenghanii TaxID=2911516 RepID=UPI001EEFAE42|nr:CDGSH iron-sulfur domain-containing protein [Gordonia zhenghanii]MCF8571962.1 CDGSH iron-sulfur domain-containing protein [Gordonia zhenghanii]MCF8603703.1 CDGSH iron-sulfur domain-containing protein [Gordonia zhenghanii]MCF8604180.1 CDGSH iron-sulfur domain-containing protein [Gordonia zhenghanii]